MENITERTAFAAVLAVGLALVLLLLQLPVAKAQSDGGGTATPAVFTFAEPSGPDDRGPCGGVDWAVCKSSDTRDDPPPPPDGPA
jgi:hypothetical protein